MHLEHELTPHFTESIFTHMFVFLVLSPVSDKLEATRFTLVLDCTSYSLFRCTDGDRSRTRDFASCGKALEGITRERHQVGGQIKPLILLRLFHVSQPIGLLGSTHGL